MFVTDTHPIAHYAERKYSRLSRRSLQLFEDAETGSVAIYIPTITLWELTALVDRGAIKLSSRFDHWCRALNDREGFVVEPLTWQDVNEARYLPLSDPYDRLIVGTAIRLDYPLITKDQAIVDSGLVETVW